MAPQPAYVLQAVAFSIGWTAVSSQLSRIAADFGRNSFLLLCLAFYGASTGIQLAGAALDGRFDALSGLHRAQLFRAVVSFGGCAALLAALPYLQHSLAQLQCAVGGLGVLSGSAMGLSYQLAAASPASGTATASLNVGFVCSAPVVLAIQAALRLGPACAWHQMRDFHFVAAAVVAAGLVAAVAEVTRQRRRQQQQQVQQMGGGVDEPLLAAEAARDGSSGMPLHHQQQHLRPSSSSTSLDIDALLPSSQAPALRAAWPALAALAASTATSMCLFPLFTHFPSAGQLPPLLLPTVLFWVRCACDITGRLLPWPRPTAAALLAVAALRVLLLAPALAYVRGGLPPALHSDWLLSAYVAAMWLAGGAVAVQSYKLLPLLLPPPLLRRGTAAMAIAFNAACLLGLLLAVPVTRLIGA